MKKIRVASLVWKDAYGGAERSLADLAAAIDQNRFDIQFFFLSGQEGVFSSQIHELGFKVQYLNWSSGFSVKGRLRLISELHNFDPMIIHDHTPPLLLRPMIKFSMNCPIITTEHGKAIGHGAKGGSLMRRCFETIDLFFCDRVLANSYESKDAVHKVYNYPISKIAVLYLGINLKKFKFKATAPFTLGKRRIGYAGRIYNIQKGVDFIPHIARELLARGMRDIEFVVIGDGPDRKEVESLCQDLGVYHLFHFLGFCPDIESILPSLDVLLIPSRYEPFGLTALEALAVGVPVVGFDVRGLNEAVGDCQNAVLVQPGDLHAMIEAVEYFLNNPRIYSALGRRYVEEHYSNERMAADMQRVYESLTMQSSFLGH